MKSNHNQRNKNSSSRNAKSKNNISPSIGLPQLKALIIEIMSKQKRFGYSPRTILRELQWKNKEAKENVETAMEALAEEKLIYLDAEGRYQLQAVSPEMVIATIDHVNQRFAFGIVEGNPKDIKISTEDLNGALDGDLVEIDLFQHQNGSNPEGAVGKILQRKRERFVGTLELHNTTAFVVPDSRRIYNDFYIPPHKLKEAKHGEKVIVQVTKWAYGIRKHEAEVVEVLGKAGENNTEMHAIMAEFDLPYEFPESVLKAAENIADDITKEEIARRRDFRKVCTFTIDPYDAKDFDDALSIQQLPNGHYEIGVLIADVTHYVKPNSTLEKEAYKRATSVYLVDRVVPMLPERLSNELCSLRPHEEKLTFSAVFEMDETGHIHQEWFGKTVIYSDRRFTYEEAQERIESKEGDLAKEINILNDLAYALRAERFRAGAISFETPEVKFRLDEQGKPLAVVPKVRKDAHKLVEEFMLLANKRVAEFVYKLRKKPRPYTMVYRIHEAPDPERLQTFATFVQRFGYKIVTEGKQMSDSFNKMTEAMENKPEQNILQNLAIRTMSKAVYSTEPKGHFGLAFAHYSHFTSPIRRYPDMMTHRLLEHYLQKGKSASKESYEEKCKHSSDMEKRAADAERASIKYKQVEFMQMMEDRVFDGIVTGVTDFGVYVEIIETKCEGLIRMSDLDDDFYQLDAANYRIVGRGTGRIIAFGDALQVRIKDTNLARRTIDLSLVTAQKSKQPNSHKTQRTNDTKSGERKSRSSKNRRSKK